MIGPTEHFRNESLAELFVFHRYLSFRACINPRLQGFRNDGLHRISDGLNGFMRNE